MRRLGGSKCCNKKSDKKTGRFAELLFYHFLFSLLVKQYLI